MDKWAHASGHDAMVGCIGSAGTLLLAPWALPKRSSLAAAAEHTSQ